MSLFNFPLGAAALARICEQKVSGAYIGLTSRAMLPERSIGQVEISKCGDAMLRSYLFEAAGVLLTRVPKWQRNQSEGTAIIR